MSHPELSSIIVGIAYDNLKHSKIIQELFKPVTKLDLSPKCDDDQVKVWKEIHSCLDQLSSIETISDEMLPDFIKGLTNLEDCMDEIYSYFLKSEMLKNFVDGFSSLMPITIDNLTFIINMMSEDNVRHRAMLIEVIYYFNKNILKNVESNAPIVKYQNPDAWISG